MSRISKKELADFFKVHRNTLKKRVDEYGGIDTHDHESILLFVIWHVVNYKRSLLMEDF